MWGYPYLTWLAIVVMFGIVAAMAFQSRTNALRSFSGWPAPSAMLLAYGLRHRFAGIRGAPRTGPATRD